MSINALEKIPAAPVAKTGWPWVPEQGPRAEGQIWPKISIITPSYNQGQFIEETIRSVLLQNYPNLEYFVIDGGSHDSSLMTIEKYANRLTWWVSEKDQGQCDAIAKGLSRSTGEIFTWINSDDILMPNALHTIAKYFRGSDALAGSVVNFADSREWLTKNRNLSAENLLRWRNGVSFHQPGVWLKRDKVLLCGGLDLNLNHSFDIDLMIRYLDNFPSVQYVETPLVRFRYHKNSKTVSQQNHFRKDHEEIVKKYLSNPSSARLERYAKLWQRDLDWDRQRKFYLYHSTAPRFVRAAKLAFEMINDPLNRIDRKSLGALKRILR